MKFRGFCLNLHHSKKRCITVEQFLNNVGSMLTKVSDVVCGYPFFVLLIGGGLSFSSIPVGYPFVVMAMLSRHCVITKEMEAQAR